MWVATSSTDPACDQIDLDTPAPDDAGGDDGGTPPSNDPGTGAGSPDDPNGDGSGDGGSGNAGGDNGTASAWGEDVPDFSLQVDQL